MNGDGIDDFALGAQGADPDGRLNAGAVYVIFGAYPLCLPGSVNAVAGLTEVTDVLLINGSAGDEQRTVQVSAGERIWTTMLPPPMGGNGRFVVHANFGARPNEPTEVPFNIGVTCFPMILPEATPAGIWNNAGKTGLVGSSQYLDGTPITDPQQAPAIFLLLQNGDAANLPPGTTVTFQGLIVDPGSASSKGMSATNGVVLMVTP